MSDAEVESLRGEVATLSGVVAELGGMVQDLSGDIVRFVAAQRHARTRGTTR